jgi:uncharacterized protein
MTPQEQQLVADLFDRLASLEGQRRDPDAERLIREGFGRAPNAVYALVQSVLVQDEALKRAGARIEELEHAAQPAEPPQGGGFLDNMRNVLTGRDPGRGSVPSVRPGGQGSSGVWGSRPEPSAPAGYPPGAQMAAPMGGPAGGGMMGGGMMGGGMMGGMAPGSGGGSFLGTAAATVAGVVGGAMLLNSVRSMMGGGHQSFAGDLDRTDPGASSRAASPWDSGGNSGGGDLSRDAGVGDIGHGGRSASNDGSGRSGFLGGAADNEPQDQPEDQPEDDYDNAGHIDGGDDSDTA